MSNWGSVLSAKKTSREISYTYKILFYYFIKIISYTKHIYMLMLDKKEWTRFSGNLNYKCKQIIFCPTFFITSIAINTYVILIEKLKE